MVFAPVGIRCPDHASVGAVKPNAARTVRQVRGSINRTGNPVTAVLVAINVVVFLITLAQGSGGQPGGEVFNRGALFVSFPGFDQGLAHGEWWRLFTSMFLHGSFLHIAFNMFALWWLGSVVEQSLGALRYLLLYIASGLAGSTGAIISAPHAVTVGASGAIFGLLGALLVLEYLQTGSFAGQAMTLIIVNLALSFAIANVSIGGHVGGLIGGVLVGIVFDQADRRRLPALAYAGSLVIAAIAVVGALQAAA
jgi:membrane associated rhomboid family serine protease